MTEEEFKELIRILTQPHRVQNVFALFKHCEQAAELLQAQKHELEELRLAAPKPKKAKATSAKKKRARDEKGRLIGDDPNTPENEAWVNDTQEGTA